MGNRIGGNGGGGGQPSTVDLRLRKLHEVSLDEVVNLAVHHTAYITCLIVSAVILHSPVVEDIRANLTAPLYLLLTSLNLLLLCHLLLQGTVIEL